MFISNNPSEEEKTSYGGHKLSEYHPVRVLEPFREGYSEDRDSSSPDQDLANSYRSNWIRLQLQDSHYVLIPDWDDIVVRADVNEIRNEDATGQLIWRAIRGFVLTNTHPNGDPQFVQDEALLRQLLADAIRNEGIEDSISAAVTHKRMRWTEYARIAPLSVKAALGLARDWGQAALLQISSDGRVKVHSLSSEVPDSSYRARLLKLNIKPCPMREGFEQQYLCRLQGGPWVSRSIHLAAHWKSYRSRNLELLGCGPCEDGKKPIANHLGEPWLQGGPISLSPLSIPSRHGRPIYGKSE